MDGQRRFRRRLAWTLLLAATLLPVGAAAQPAAPPDRPDAQVLSQMIRANEMLVQLAALAREKAQDESVRDYAERGEKDHRFALAKLRDLARDQGIEIPAAARQGEQPRSEPRPGQQTQTPSSSMQKMKMMAQNLRQAPRAQFDQKYLQAMAKMHQNLQQQLTTAADQVDDHELRELIRDLVPILGQHQQLAQHIEIARTTATAQATSSGEEGER